MVRKLSMSFLNDSWACAEARLCSQVLAVPTDSTMAAVSKGAASSLVPRFMLSCPSPPARRLLVDPAADHGVVELLAVHALGFDLLGHRVGELVVLPESALALCELHALLHEGLAVHVL